MKVINYKYGYFFDCSIHGKIQVSRAEWAKIKKYLANNKVLVAIKGTMGQFSIDELRRLLAEDMERTIKTKLGEGVNIRVSATEQVLSHFEHEGNYKRGNYYFEII